MSHVAIYVHGRLNKDASSEYGDDHKDDSEDVDEDAAKVRRERKNRYYRHMFWLVPLDIRGSKFQMSVGDALPIKRWNRSNNQLIWSRERLVKSPARMGNPPMTAGVARIHLDPHYVWARKARHKGGGWAVVAFGLWRTSDSPDAPNIPWCRLIKDDGVSDLEQHLTTQVSIQDAQAGPSSLIFDAGILLHASAVRTDVAGRAYDLIKLWVTDEVVVEGDTAVAEH